MRFPTLAVRAAVLLVFLSSVARGDAVTDADAPWRAGPFEAEPAALLEACADSAARADEDVLVLLQEYRIQHDERGARTREVRLIYQVRSERGLDAWDAVSRDWSPWFEARPELRARVVGPDGAVREFDSGTLRQQSIDRGVDDDVYDDRMNVSAPIPDLRVGSVVEELWIATDQKPLFAAGTVHGYGFGRPFPILDARLFIEAPEDLPLRWRIRGIEPRSVQDEARDGVRHVVVDLGRVEGVDTSAMERLAWRHPLPRVDVSTGKDWRTVARSYAEWIDEHLDGFEVPSGVRGIVERETERDVFGEEQRIAAILDWVRESVRYTGIPFGDSALRPWGPTDVLDRGYGDCKDQSTLVVGLLRAAGLDAHVALLLTDPDIPVVEDLPGIGPFDHAIVFVDEGDGLWLDPTVGWLPVDAIAESAQGRRALVCAESTRELVEIPVMEPERNMVRETRRVEFPEVGYADVVETTWAVGPRAARFRGTFAGSSRSSLEEMFDRYVRNEYSADSLASWTDPDLDRRDLPFTSEVVARGVVHGYSDLSTVTVLVDLADLYVDLPDVLLQSPAELDPLAGYPDRVHLGKPYRSETIYRAVPPPGFVVKDPPEDIETVVGPVSMRAKFALEDGGEVVATLALEVTDVDMGLEDAETLVEAIEDLSEMQVVRIHFEHEADVALLHGDGEAAAEILRKIVDESPDDVRARVKLAEFLDALGLNEPARAHARRAAEIAPESSVAQRALAVLCSRDPYGRPMREGFDRSCALEATRRAIEIDPDAASNRVLLGELLEHDDAGRRFGPGSDLPAAMLAYASALALDDDVSSADRTLQIAVFAEDWDLLGAIADTCSNETAARRLQTFHAALTEGAGPAARIARRGQSAEEAGALLTELLPYTLMARHYSLTADMIEEALDGRPPDRETSQYVRLMRSVQRVRSDELDLEGPVGAVRQFLWASTITDRDDVRVGLDDRLDPLLLKAHRRAEDDHARATERALDVLLPEHGAEDAAYLGVGVDVILSEMNATVEEDGAGSYRVRYENRRGEHMSLEEHVFVVERDGRFRVLCDRSNLAPLALRMLELLDAGELGAAKVVAEWLPTGPPSSAEDVLRTGLLARALERADLDDPVVLRSIAFAAILSSEHELDVLPWIDEALAETSDPSVRSILNQGVLIAAWERHEDEFLLPALRELARLHPESSLAWISLAVTLVRTGHHAEYEALLESDLSDDDVLRERVRAEALVFGGDTEGAIEVLEGLVENGHAEPTDHNSLAWYRLCLGQSDDETLEHALESLVGGIEGSSASLHTLACVYAERGELRQAHQSWVEAQEESGLDVPDDAWRYVLARIAEAVGEVEWARIVYEGLEDDASGTPEEISVKSLAERRLQVMANDRS